MVFQMKLLLIGAGKWGTNYISTLSSFENIELTVANKENWQHLIDQKPDGVIIATPPQSHIQIAEHAASYQIPIMLEKPVALSSSELQILNNYNPTVLVNYIHLFSDAYQWMIKSIDVDTITKISTHGYNRGPFRNYSSLWDYAPHDLSMILYLLKEAPTCLDIQLIPNTNNGLFGIEMLFNKCTTYSMVGSGGTNACRDFIVEFNGMMLKYDDKNRPTSHTAPLNNALSVFIKGIKGHIDERMGLELSFQITKILERCDNKLICNGD